MWPRRSLADDKTKDGSSSRGPIPPKQVSDRCPRQRCTLNTAVGEPDQQLTARPQMRCSSRSATSHPTTCSRTDCENTKSNTRSANDSRFKSATVKVALTGALPAPVPLRSPKCPRRQTGPRIFAANQFVILPAPDPLRGSGCHADIELRSDPASPARSQCHRARDATPAVFRSTERSS